MRRIKQLNWRDVLAFATLIILPLLVYWRVWAPLETDRLLFDGDILWNSYPHRFATHEALMRGEIPLWDPYVLSGLPLFGDAQSAVFYIPNMLLSLIFWGRELPYTGFLGMVVAHYSIAGVFFYAYLRGIGLRPNAAMVGAIAYQFNGFFIGHRGHYMILSVSIWIPLAMFLLDRAWHSHKRSRRWLWAILAALPFSQMVHGGHPQTLFFSVIFVSCYFLFRWTQIFDWNAWWHETPRRSKLLHPMIERPLQYGVAGGLGVGLSVIFLFPMLELLGRSLRSDLDWRFTAEFSFPPRNLVSLLMPELLQFSGTEFRVYAGILTLVLALVAWIIPNIVRSERRFFTIALVVATILSFGGFFILQPALYRFAPGFSSIRVMARAFHLGNLSLAALAALGAETLFQTQFAAEERKRLEKLLLQGRSLVYALLGISFLMIVLLSWNYVPIWGEGLHPDFLRTSSEDPTLRLSHVINQYMLFVIFLVSSLLILWVRLRGHLVGAGLVFATCFMMFTDVATFAPYHDTLVTTTPNEMYFSDDEYYTRLRTEAWQISDQRILQDTIQSLPPLTRIDNDSQVLPANYSTIWEYPFSTGRNILDLKERGQLRNWPNPTQDEVWDLLNVGYILTMPEDDAPPNATPLVSNSQGTLWERNEQPAYAHFSTRIRPLDAAYANQSALSFAPTGLYDQPSISADENTVDTLLTLWPELEQDNLYKIGRTGITSPVDLHVLSSKGVASIAVAGESVTETTRGIHIAVVDAESGKVTASGAFDTYASTFDSDRLAAIIESAPRGSIVMMAIQDEGTASLTERAINAMSSIGSSLNLQEFYGQSWALIGVKGSAPNSALEIVNPNSAVVLDVGLAAADLPATAEFDSQVVTYDHNGFTLLVQNSEKGLLTVSETVYPGWKAYIDGKETPVLRSNGLFRSVILPASSDEPHEVTFTFEPASYHIGKAITQATLLLSLGALMSLLLFELPQRRTAASAPPAIVPQPPLATAIAVHAPAAALPPQPDPQQAQRPRAASRLASLRSRIRRPQFSYFKRLTSVIRRPALPQSAAPTPPLEPNETPVAAMPTVETPPAPTMAPAASAPAAPIVPPAAPRRPNFRRGPKLVFRTKQSVDSAEAPPAEPNAAQPAAAQSAAPAPQPPVQPVAAQPVAPAPQPPVQPVAVQPVAPAPQLPVQPVAAQPVAPAPQPPVQPVAVQPVAPASQPSVQPVAAQPIAPAPQPAAPTLQPPVQPIVIQPAALASSDNNVDDILWAMFGVEETDDDKEEAINSIVEQPQVEAPSEPIMAQPASAITIDPTPLAEPTSQSVDSAEAIVAQPEAPAIDHEPAQTIETVSADASTPAAVETEAQPTEEAEIEPVAEPIETEPVVSDVPAAAVKSADEELITESTEEPMAASVDSAESADDDEPNNYSSDTSTFGLFGVDFELDWD